jgi:hypothetical protein
MEDLLIYKNLWGYLSMEESANRTAEVKRGDRKTLSLVRSHNSINPTSKLSLHAWRIGCTVDTVV